MIPSDLQFLAQDDPSIARPLIWSLVLIVIIVALFGVVMLYRKWLNADETSKDQGFTLSDLRRLHKSGQMTDDEFEKAKTILIGSVKTGTDKPVLGERDTTKGPNSGPRTNPPR